MVSLSDLSAPENVTVPVKKNIRKPFTQISAALHGKNDSIMTAEEKTKLFHKFVRKKNGIRNR
jgi:hypothetical protein